MRVDPDKEKEISAVTRKWALDLIDANAGGVKFSPEARAQLLGEPLGYAGYTDYGSYSYAQVTPAPRYSSPEPPK